MGGISLDILGYFELLYFINNQCEKNQSCPPRENTMTRVSREQLTELSLMAKEHRLTRTNLLNAIIHEKFENYLKEKNHHAAV
jgi:hypothetical protein